MIHPLLEIGGVIFWIITAIVALFVISETHRERMTTTTLTVLGYIVGFILLTNGGMALFTYIRDHPLYLIYGLVGYVLAGAVWATAKWRVFFLPNLFEVYDELRQEFMKKNNLKEIPADVKIRNELEHFVSRSGVYIQQQRMVSNNKGRIIGWLTYWPLSLLGTFFGDFLIRLAKTVYNAIAGLLQRLSDQMASKYSELE